MEALPRRHAGDALGAVGPNHVRDAFGGGFKGRCGLHELMIASDAIKKMIQEKARVADLFIKSVEEGMSTLKMDGMDKVMMGLTDMAQVRTVCIK